MALSSHFTKKLARNYRQIFILRTYSSWERGLNENTNGLVRQYLKKGSSFSNVTDIQLAMIANDLNNRPRKKLGYATPNEIFNQVFVTARVYKHPDSQSSHFFCPN
jgi:IS30 family transposase